MRCLYMRPKELFTESGFRYVIEYPCNKCMPCRLNKQSEWAGRILMEDMTARDSVFVTLTYDPEFEPPGRSLSKRDVQLYLKRLRKRLPPKLLRHFAVGEYGHKTGRLHYHLVLFGVGVADEEDIKLSWQPKYHKATVPRHLQRQIANFDGKRLIGFVDVRELDVRRAMYVAKYTTKRLISQDTLPDGRVAPFMLCSRRPGLGSAFAMKMATDLKKRDLQTSVVSLKGDFMKVEKPFVPGCLKYGKSMFPLDGYVRTLLAKALGICAEEKARWIQVNRENDLDMIPFEVRHERRQYDIVKSAKVFEMSRRRAVL